MRSCLLKEFRISNILFIFFFVVSSLAGCGGGGGGGSTPTQVATVTVSGAITFDLVPADPTAGLVYANTTQKPARGIVIEGINASNSSLLDSTTTDASGNYSLTVPQNTDVKIRIKAQMLKTGTPSWDFQVVDNTDSQSLYVADSSSFNSGTSSITKNLNAPSGWGGSSYTSARVAAPFAILNTVYKAATKITSADNTVHFPQLLINWSVNNVPSSGDVTLGQIGTSYYSSQAKQLYILGAADTDTDEFDDHVIAHEWGHYFEANFSRSDSPGGSHGSGDLLDPRVAFGEGFGNAFSGMATGDPIYVDTGGQSQASINVTMDLTDSNGDPNSIGWYSEDSVQYILYSLYTDLGFQPLYTVFTTQQKTTNSFTSIYSFISYLKTNNPSATATINALLAIKDISSTFIDPWDSTKTETNDAGDPKVLPVYTLVSAGSSTVRVCTNDEFGTYNKLMNRKFVLFQVSSDANYNLTIAAATPSGIPDYRLFSNGQEIDVSNNSSSAVFTTSGYLTTGTYYAEIFDSRQGAGSSPPVGQICFDVRLY